MASQTLRLVSKTQYDQQVFINLNPNDLGPLGPDSIRVKTETVGLTANNLAYCAAGEVLKWWYSYPIPSFVPAPYNDPSTYGISPGWGFCRILESNIPSIKPGTTIYGFCPISSFPVDLQLKQSEHDESQWHEVSPHRQQLMPLYNRYSYGAYECERNSPTGTEWIVAIRPIWTCGYLLNRLVFPSSKEQKPVHPIPDFGLPWSEADGDLTSSIVVALGAGSKTSRSFVHQLATNRTGRMPKALVEVTLGKGAGEFVKSFPFEHKVVSYSELSSAENIAWTTNLGASRIVVLDFAGRGNAHEELYDALQEAGSKLPYSLIFIGGESKVYAPEDLAARYNIPAKLNSTRCNTSGMREVAIQQLGEKTFFKQLTEAFNGVVAEQLALGENKVLGVSPHHGGGLTGDNSLEEYWKKLCSGSLSGNIGYLFDI